MARPKGFKEKTERAKTLAKSSTDAAGRYELAAEFDADGYPTRTVIVKARGSGLSGKAFSGEIVNESDRKNERLTFRLRPQVTIEGKLLTPAGRLRPGSWFCSKDFKTATMSTKAKW